MGICKLESLRFECDRCRDVAEFADAETAREQGWLSLPPIEHLRVRVLCPTDAVKLDRFFMGNKTPAGMRFNDNEQDRWERSCT